MTAVSPAHILRLPRELRDLIYDELVGTRSDGYVYDYETNRVTQLNGRPILLAFRLTCRHIAVEMQDYAFRTRTITFRTIMPEASRELAGRFDELFYRQRMTESDAIDCLRKHISDEMHDEVLSYYPQFRPLLNHLLRNPDRREILHRRWGEASSMQTLFIRHLLRLLAACSRRRATGPVRMDGPFFTVLLDIDGLIALDYPPWTIASDDILSHIGRVLGTSGYPTCHHQLYRFSAASAAIHFLSSLLIETRMQMRNIILDEDHPAVAHSQCHAHGFVGFCLENPELRVERRVNLWRNVFQAGHWDDWRPLYADSRLGTEATRYSPTATHVKDCVASWIVEARALPSLGMPAGAFTLVFNGDCIPQQSFEAFRAVRHYAIQQFLMEQNHEDLHQVDVPLYAERQDSPEYTFEGFPDAVDDMCRGEGFIKCNFSISDSWVAISGEESIEPKTRLTSMLEANPLPQTIETSRPLPPWRVLVRENATVFLM